MPRHAESRQVAGLQGRSCTSGARMLMCAALKAHLATMLPLQHSSPPYAPWPPAWSAPCQIPGPRPRSSHWSEPTVQFQGHPAH